MNTLEAWKQVPGQQDQDLKWWDKRRRRLLLGRWNDLPKALEKWENVPFACGSTTIATQFPKDCSISDDKKEEFKQQDKPRTRRSANWLLEGSLPSRLAFPCSLSYNCL